MRYWLMKSEPDVYSIEDLQRDQTELWDGVRNYQARNFLKEMALDDLAFFYHSNTKPPGIVGLMKIVETNVVDLLPNSTRPTSITTPNPHQKNPRWHTVTVGYVETFKTGITLEQLKAEFEPDELWVVRRGNRLSVMPVEEAVAKKLLDLAHRG